MSILGGRRVSSTVRYTVDKVVAPFGGWGIWERPLHKLKMGMEGDGVGEGMKVGGMEEKMGGEIDGEIGEGMAGDRTSNERGLEREGNEEGVRQGERRGGEGGNTVEMKMEMEGGGMLDGEGNRGRRMVHERAEERREDEERRRSESQTTIG